MKTKKIAIKLAALTRVEYFEVIEVPESMTEEQLNELVDRRYDVVDGGSFVDDPDYWEKATCEHELAGNECRPSLRLRIDAGGDFKLTPIKNRGAK